MWIQEHSQSGSGSYEGRQVICLGNIQTIPTSVTASTVEWPLHRGSDTNAHLLVLISPRTICACADRGTLSASLLHCHTQVPFTFRLSTTRQQSLTQTHSSALHTLTPSESLSSTIQAAWYSDVPLGTLLATAGLGGGMAASAKSSSVGQVCSPSIGSSSTSLCRDSCRR